MPSPLPRRVRWSLFARLSIASGLPCNKARSAPAITVSGPAQRSLTLRPARSPSRLATLYTEGSDSFVASTAAAISYRVERTSPRAGVPPAEVQRLSRRTLSPTDWRLVVRIASMKIAGQSVTFILIQIQLPGCCANRSSMQCRCERRQALLTDR
jgi:hypothetical protein